jgi:hypothetical protein
MKKILIWGSLLVILAAACAPFPAQGLSSSGASPASQTPGSPAASLDATRMFSTSVVATKFADQTQMAGAPTLTSTPTVVSTSSECRPKDLRVDFGTNGAGGNIVLQVSVTNQGGTDCWLPLRPTAQLLDGTGKPLELSYGVLNLSDSRATPAPTRPPEFGLKAGQTAGLMLLWANWCQQPVKGGVTIRLRLLGDAGWLDVPTGVETGGRCDAPDQPSSLVIGEFAPG